MCDMVVLVIHKILYDHINDLDLVDSYREQMCRRDVCFSLNTRLAPFSRLQRVTSLVLPLMYMYLKPEYYNMIYHEKKKPNVGVD